MALVYHSQAGVGIAAAFLFCNAIYLILEWAIPNRRPHIRSERRRNWMTITQYLVVPSFIVLLGIILTPFLFLGKPGPDERCNDLKDSIEADIAGLGIRITAWAQITILFVIVLLGIFHTQVNRVAKEVGAGLAVTYLALAIALLINKGDTALVNKILGSMILDAQNIALSIPLVTKETLAARWQVVVTVACQTFGLVLLGIIVSGFGSDTVDITNCPCLSAAWWGDVGNCTKSPASTIVGHEMKACWIYYACRWLSLFQSSFHSLMNMSKFHKAEKSGDLPLRGLTFPRPSLEPTGLRRYIFVGLYRLPKFHEYTNTVSLAFLVYAMFAIVSMAAAENLLGNLDTRGGTKVSFGQAVAIVAAAATIVRGIWLLYKTPVKELI
ncbi:hypothetical protein LZ32DRAFT_363287 [Colletotrichum eremochloae]|nr:hypothetical protein LZ32DRAFT_363287 [Colletotrichum eremochloae]